MAKPPLRFGVIGHGPVGQAWSAAIAASPRADVAATSGPNGEPGRHLHFESGEGLLAREDLDAVALACPWSEARRLAEAALAQSRHVVCAGAPGASAADAEAIRAASETSGAVFQAACPIAFHGSALRAFDLISQGGFGDVVSVRAVFGAARADEAWMPGEGGVALERGFALVQLAGRLCGGIVSANGAATRDNVMAALRGANGALVSLHASNTQWRSVFRLEIGLEKGYLWLDGLDTTSRAFAPEMLISARVKLDKDGAPLPDPPEEARQFDEGRAAVDRALSAFLDTVDGAPPPPFCDAAAACEAMAVIQSLYDQSA